MSLGGAGVLVTRPKHQARELIDAVTDAGGVALPFPVIDIEAREPAAIRTDAGLLQTPDIVVFVSRNAVLHGLGTMSGLTARIAAIGPATAEALAAAGHRADIVPAYGYDSEHLLSEDAFDDVSGRRVRIIRGDGGRELLGRTLRERGAAVDYLAVYRRVRHRFSAAEIAAVAERWQRGEVRFFTAMSIASLDFLLGSLPAACLERIALARLVTPSERVIQTALARIPQVHSMLAAGPGAGDMVAAMIDSLRPRTDDAHE